VLRTNSRKLSVTSHKIYEQESTKMFHPLTHAAEMNNKGAESLQSGALVLAIQFFRRALELTLENPPPSYQNGAPENRTDHNDYSNNYLLLERMADDSSPGVYADPVFIRRAEDNSCSEPEGFFCQDDTLDYDIFSAIVTFNTALVHHRLALGVRPGQQFDCKAKALYHLSIMLLSPDDVYHYTLLAPGIAGATCDLIIMASLNNLEQLDPTCNSSYTKHLVQLALQRVDYGEDVISDCMAAWKGMFLFNSITASSRSHLCPPAA
jgi:hypothetical protein